MKTTCITKFSGCLALIGLSATVALGAVQSTRAAATVAPREQEPASSAATLQDAQLPEGSLRLAAIAFEAGSKPPAVPHAKNRARMQAAVVEMCAEVGLLKSGLAWAGRIEGWQQGVSMTQLALAAARAGSKRGAEEPLARAMAIAADASPAAFAQEWQRDRIRAGIATALIRLGREQEAHNFESDLEHSETDAPLIARSEACTQESFERQVAAIEQSLASNHFDRMRHAVRACIALARRFAGEPEKVGALEARVNAVIAKFPAASRFDALTLMADCALERKDPARAKELAAEALAAIPVQSLPVEERLPLLGRVAVLQHRAGAADVAATGLDAALEIYNAQRERVVDIARASAVRALAESAEASGRHELAMQLWEKALLEGQVNPNARPRADDLVATCCSILRAGVVPDAALVEQAEQQLKGLRAPW